MYLVKRHLNVHSIYWNVTFLIFSNLSSLLHSLTYLWLLNSFLLLVLSRFSVFLKSLITIFSDGLLTSLFLQNFSVVFQSFFFIQLFPVFHEPGFSGITFFRVKVFQGLAFSGYGSRVQVQGLSPGFRRSRCKATLLKQHYCMGVLL